MTTPSKPERRGVVAEVLRFVACNYEITVLGCFGISILALLPILWFLGAVVALLMGWRPWL